MKHLSACEARGGEPHPALPARKCVTSSVALLLALTLMACSSAPPLPISRQVLQHAGGGANDSRDGQNSCARPPIEVFLQADSTLNPNPEGQSMPVETKVLLLRSRERFDQLDFETLWQRPQEALGSHLVSSAELTVFPGQLKIYPMKSAPGVAYVAMVAIFRRPEGDSWRYVLDVSEQNKQCADKEALHTIVHAQLHDSTIEKPDPDAVRPPSGK